MTQHVCSMLKPWFRLQYWLGREINKSMVDKSVQVLLFMDRACPLLEDEPVARRMRISLGPVPVLDALVSCTSEFSVLQS